MTGYAAIALELSHDCVCGTQVALNAVVPRVACVQCGRFIEMAPDTWAALFRDCIGGSFAPEEQKALLFNAPAGVVRLSIRRGAANCSACGAPLDLGQLPTLACPGHFHCGQCGHPEAVRRLPEVAPDAEWLLGEDDELLNPRALAGHESVVLPCGECGAPLPVDGTTRSLTCGHCNTVSIVPDAVWERVHRSRGVRRFYAIVAAPASVQPAVDFSYVSAGVSDAAGNLYLISGSVFSVDSALRLRWRRSDIEREDIKREGITIVGDRVVAFTGRKCTPLTLDKGENARAFTPDIPITWMSGAPDGTAFAVKGVGVIGADDSRLARLDASGRQTMPFPTQPELPIGHKLLVAANPQGGVVMLDLVRESTMVCRFFDAGGREVEAWAIHGPAPVDPFKDTKLAVDEFGRAYASCDNLVFIFDHGIRLHCRTTDRIPRRSSNKLLRMPGAPTSQCTCSSARGCSSMATRRTSIWKQRGCDR